MPERLILTRGKASTLRVLLLLSRFMREAKAAGEDVRVTVERVRDDG